MAQRVLIVEDELLLAMQMADLLRDMAYEPVGPFARVVTAIPVAIRAPLDAALLDFGLRDETVEPLAGILQRRGIPFAMVTAHSRDLLPAGLRGHPYLSKPFADEDVAGLLARILGHA